MWYLEDGYGAAKIGNLLNEQGLKTKRNCNWSQNAVCRILTNERQSNKYLFSTLIRCKECGCSFRTYGSNKIEQFIWRIGAIEWQIVWNYLLFLL